MNDERNWWRWRLPWRFWIGVLIVWTALLLTPADWFGKTSSAKIGQFGLGKLLHMGSYFLLAASAGWLRPALPVRLAMIPLLILHGGLTEILQNWVPGREGCWSDVGIDSASILSGFLLTCWFWPPSAATDASEQSKDRPQIYQR
jgi:VanZ family protein